eukprot:TRINITY_DN3206_c0_g1::TRINITY_DN3206_c0_g1_i1::g.29698::m.29698 TRINITY_DN3206_c0_g1::TRINITY_DN3206_c0_g1_i1::g.29698  ORF type:complete len:177 (+),score=29.18,sp/Q8LBK6/GRS15_ARATH/39.63/6e-37,Glutaredoxin/PF00462.19/2.7e-21,SH3BGR/PF04908.10/0.046,ArsC/PF03960.10/0.064,Phlebovirus_G1/PF07243.6/0.11 TRINITY_DN3206_c0_g1_i1:72-602(+)
MASRTFTICRHLSRVLAIRAPMTASQIASVNNSTVRSAPAFRSFATGHDDFKPKVNAKADFSQVHARIKEDLEKSPIVVYMKGTAKQPMCGYSNAVVRILEAHGAPFEAHNVLEDPELREGIKSFTDWPTIPQIFINKEFIGGCDIMMSMHQSGQLEEALRPVVEKYMKKDEGSSN